MKKTAAKRFKSDALEAVHSSARALLAVGGVTKAAFRQFDDACLATPRALGPREIRSLRRRYGVSRLVFARYLNTSPNTVAKWEAGAKRPSAMALKLLAVIEKHGLDVLA